MTPKQVVERYLAEALTGDGDSSAELISNEEVLQRTLKLRLAFPDLEIETIVLLGEGDLVAGHLVGRGTHNGMFNGVPPSGRSWEARCTAIFRVTDERIADGWVTWDTLALMEQLGGVKRAETASA